MGGNSGLPKGHGAGSSGSPGDLGSPGPAGPAALGREETVTSSSVSPTFIEGEGGLCVATPGASDRMALREECWLLPL